MSMEVDEELLKLCKEVYKRTGWETKTRVASFPDEWRIFTKEQWESLPIKFIDSFFLYTSDCLLEKLPKHLASQEKLNVTYFDEVPETGEICWRAEYTHLFADGTWDIRWEYQGNGNTPLKALLKLVIALDDAGVRL